MNGDEKCVLKLSMYKTPSDRSSHNCISSLETAIINLYVHHIQNADTMVYYIMREIKYSQTVLHAVHVAVETSSVYHNSVTSMALVVMQPVILITLRLIGITSISKELVNMSLLDHVVLKIFQSLFLMVPTINMSLVLIQ